jgi:hypothetical protein
MEIESISTGAIMAASATSWNVSSGFTIEELTDDELPESLRGIRIDSLDFVFRSIGFYQPRSMYGGPDQLGWPEDGDDERELLSVKAEREDRTPIKLNQQQIADALAFPAFTQRMNEQELEHEEYSDE